VKSLATGIPPGKLILDSIERLALSGLKEPMHHLCNSLSLQDDGHPTDTAIAPCLLGIDLCTPERSRLKFYVTGGIMGSGTRHMDSSQENVWKILNVPMV
jgi:hypothetical protein